MKYRAKKDNETWNVYLMKIFREGKHVRFPDFLDEYFKVEGRREEYQAGIKQDAIDKENSLKTDTKKKVKVNERKTSFAKKPERLKKKKGYLF